MCLCEEGKEIQITSPHHKARYKKLTNTGGDLKICASKVIELKEQKGKLNQILE